MTGPQEGGPISPSSLPPSTPIFAARNLPTIRARRPRFFREIPPLLVGRFLGPDGIAGPPGIEGLDRPRPTGGSFSPRFKDAAAFPRHRTLDPSAPINTIGGQASTGNRPTSGGQIVDDSRCLHFFLEPADTL